MYIKFLYYGKNADNRYLIGARIITESQEGINVQEIYIGQIYQIEEFLNSLSILNIKTNKEKIVQEYLKRKAVNIIYFSNINKFGFLSKEDVVVNNQEELNILINSFNELEISLKRKKKHIL